MHIFYNLNHFLKNENPTYSILNLDEKEKEQQKAFLKNVCIGPQCFGNYSLMH